MRLAVVLGALALLLPSAVGQDIPAGTWARLLVDHPLLASGDRDRVLGNWLDLIEAEPGHPLVEGTLQLIEAHGSELDDPAAFHARLADLSADGMDALAARQLERLTVLSAVRWGSFPLTQDGLFHSYLSVFEVLGPLAPIGHPLAFADPTPLLREPGFGGVHAGVDGEVRWRPFLREHQRPYVMANTEIEASTGQALVAARFDVPEGGPAWLEIEAVAGGGGVFAFSGIKSVSSRGTPSYSFSLNGEEPVIVERFSRETGAVWRQAVTLRVGRNQLVLHGALNTGVAFAVRVLGTDGRTYPGLSQPYPVSPTDTAPPGASVDIAPPAEALVDSEAWLTTHPGLDSNADLLAVAGMLAYVDGRQAEGLARLRAALDLEPSRVGLRALLMRVTHDAAYLPDVWQRNRARALAEQVKADRPDHMLVGLYLARILADEDREEEAIARLLELTERHQQQSATLLELYTVYSKLDMDVAAEEALLSAVERTPNSPAVLDRLARYHYKPSGRIQAWAETAERALAARGRTPARLRSLAQQFAREGLVERAWRMYSLAMRFDDSGRTRLAYARFLVGIGQLPSAFAQAEALLARFPDWEQPHLLFADLFHREGDVARELRHLRDALERSPSMRETRDRVFALTGVEGTEAFFERYMFDAEAIRADWDDRDSEDSVVKLLDHQVVMVYADGSVERLTQNLYQARDLAGCEQLGRLRVSGEAIEVATIKADGSVFEPVRLGSSYVMPSLEPGDFVMETSRQFQRAPSNGVVRLGSWSFASTTHPFEISRYVVSVPHSLGLRMELRNGAEEVEQIIGPDATVHVFDVRSQPRILTQPGTPPPSWYVSWVEFGMDADEDVILAQLAVAVLGPTRVTPEIRQAAAEALSEAENPSGDEARARVLHSFTNDTLDQRGGYDATQSLLAREGNATWLYSALLSAADVPYEIVWSRNIAPEADLAPDPAFVESGYWRRKLLVLVLPQDGEPAWCDMDIKTMPYGEMLGDAAGAPVLALPSMRKTTLPTLPIDERPGAHIEMRLALKPDGSADLEGSAEIRAGYGFMAKEIIRDIPEAYRRLALNGAVAQILPGASLSSFELPGLEEEDQRVGVRVTGTVDALLDDDGVALGCNLPFPSMDLESNLAGGDGVRRLPYLQGGTQIESMSVRMELAEGMDVLELPASLEASYGNSSYRLVVERDGDRAVTIQREMVLMPFYIEADGYAEFAAFCASVDEAERARLRFTRSVESGGVDREPDPR